MNISEVSVFPSPASKLHKMWKQKQPIIRKLSLTSLVKYSALSLRLTVLVLFIVPELFLHYDLFEQLVLHAFEATEP